MANPNGNTKTLTPGNPGNKGGTGRPRLSVLKEKTEWLDRILAPDFDVENAHPLERRLREIAETSSSSSTLEYIFNQKYGAPKATIKNEIGNTEVFGALGDVLPRYMDKDTAMEFLKDLYAELGGSDLDS